jgi:uncharacterized protein with PIN domain
MGFGREDKVLVCPKCGQSWGWRERLWRELEMYDAIQKKKGGFFTNVKRLIGM